MAHSPMLDIIDPGMQALLQDTGRLHHQHAGVSRSGCMDRYAAAWANRMVDNPRQAALVEIALGGFKARAHQEVWLAVSGAEVTIKAGGRQVPCWSRFKLEAGDELELGFARSGQRAYLAVAGGGFQASRVLGSVATHVRNGLGGLNGQGAPLAKGDHLTFNSMADSHASFVASARTPWRSIPDYRQSTRLRVQVGADFKQLSSAAQQQFFLTQWQVSPQSDRMGVRLGAEHPLTERPRRVYSLGIAPGTIQLPPDGNPIVLMADCQTMGGYPVIGWLNSLDVGRLAQVAARGLVEFEEQSIEAMQQDLVEFDQFFWR